MTDHLEKTPAAPAARPARKTRGVTAGRVMAAGAGVAAMVGLAAQMQLAGSGDAGAASAGTRHARPGSDTRIVRWEHDAYQSHSTDDLEYAATERKPIVLTPHTIVNTVGGGSSGGSVGYSAPSYSAPAAAPVASSGGSAPH